ncbi:mesenchyme-specific cell surface glycoprotein-like [Lytechinus pictus]|uniref:mesenchyme-specific cell surface glycoprotein-like n=1 Tax=Lytechinus pictus TaxID=7653 RepID=UPI0030BA0569
MAVKSFLIGLFMAACIDVSFSVLSMIPVSNLKIPWNIVPRGGRTENLYGLNRGAAEKSAFDVDNMVAYTAGHHLIHIINFTDVVRPKIERSFHVNDPVIDIAECGNLVAFTSRPRRSRGLNPLDPGTVHIFRKYPVFDSICNLTVGSNPKSLKFDYKCDTIVIANEGPAAEDVEQEVFMNPEGTISVVRINNTMVNPGMSMCPPMPYGSDVRHLDFRLFNDPMLKPMMDAQFIRHPYKGQLDGERHTFSMSVEPEYVTLDPWQPVAWVSLQENNAVAEVFYDNMTMLIHPMGLKNWTNYYIDASSKDGGRRQGGRAIHYGRYPIESLLQPDAIETMTIGGDQFLITANEGAPLSYVCESCEVENEYIEYEEAAELAGDYLLSSNVPQGVRRAMTRPNQLGELRISTVDGLQQGNPEVIDRPVFFGGRGISMFHVNLMGSLDLVWDSGDVISKGIQDLHPNAFNHPPFGNPEINEGVVVPDSPINRQWDSWSPFTGAECQSLAVGQFNVTHKVIIVGIKGANALAIFTVDMFNNFTLPVFESVFRDGDIKGNARPPKTYNQLYRQDVRFGLGSNGIGNLDPDSIVFIPPEKTPGRVPMVLVTSRVSGTVNLYRLTDFPRNQLLRQQRTALHGDARCIAPSLALSLLVSILTLFYVTQRH